MSTEATFNASYQRLKHLMTCFVCYNKYSASRKPKWLLCAHHFCKECLIEIQQNGALKCPLCRQLQLYSEVTSIMPNVVDDLIERAASQLAKLKANRRLKRELETNLNKMIELRGIRETKLEEDLTNFRELPKYKDFSALRSALSLMKSQVFPLMAQDRIDFYSHFADKVELHLRNANNVKIDEVISWIEGMHSKIPAEDFTKYYFIRALVAAVINCSIEDRAGITMLYTSILKQWAPMLKKFVDSDIVFNTKCNNANMEIRLILAVQELVSRRQHPTGLMLDILNAFCEKGMFLSCFNLIRTYPSIQSIAFSFYIASCLP